jgi:uncharacterized protein YjbJ (UPF0337 family)
MGGQVMGQAQQMGGQVQEMAGQVVGQASQVVGQAGHVVGQVPSQMQRQAQGFWQMVEANPVAVAALGSVLGGVAGLLIPETEKENQLLGETRDRVVGNVQEMAGQAVDKAQRVAGEVMEAGQAVIESTKFPAGGYGYERQRQRFWSILIVVVPSAIASTRWRVSSNRNVASVPERWFEGSPTGEPSFLLVLPSSLWEPLLRTDRSISSHLTSMTR